MEQSGEKAAADPQPTGAVGLCGTERLGEGLGYQQVVGMYSLPDSIVGRAGIADGASGGGMWNGSTARLPIGCGCPERPG